MLCMFHPEGHPMERGWVGRVEGDRVIHLAAQTLQSFYTGGGAAREHAVYPLSGVRMLAPVLHPPAVRVFDDRAAFSFANPAAIVGPAAVVSPPARRAPDNRPLPGGLTLHPRIAAVIGAEGAIGGFTAFGEWRDSDLAPPKDRDFALGLGPVVVTPDQIGVDGVDAAVRVDGGRRLRARFADFDWDAARDLAEDGTVIRPGDLIAGPALDPVDIALGSVVALEIEGIGVLDATLLGG